VPADALADFAQTEERHESDDNADGADDADNPAHEQFLPESTGAMCARNTGHVLQGQLSPSAAWASVRWRAQLRRTFLDAASFDNGKGAGIGYGEPYATRHDALDRDEPMQEETRNVARAVARAVTELRTGRL
jgi:hypothetical protein